MRYGFGVGLGVGLGWGWGWGFESYLCEDADGVVKVVHASDGAGQRLWTEREAWIGVRD